MLEPLGMRVDGERFHGHYPEHREYRYRDPDLRRARARWLCALVARFGADVVGRWREPPRGFEFEAWRERHSLDETA